MTAYVYVSLKKSVLDPQGKTIHGALKKMGGLSREEAQSEVERIAREVLTNPVIEEFRFSLAE
jgi:phosphoribosylformylglycinamidine synthase